MLSRVLDIISDIVDKIGWSLLSFCIDVISIDFWGYCFSIDEIILNSSCDEEYGTSIEEYACSSCTDDNSQSAADDDSSTGVDDDSLSDDNSLSVVVDSSSGVDDDSTFNAAVEDSSFWKYLQNLKIHLNLCNDLTE